MYTLILFITFFLSGNSTVQKITFESYNLCEQAKAQIITDFTDMTTSQLSNDYINIKRISGTCVKTKS